VITLEADSPVPPYEQVRAQIAEQVRDQRLPAGTKLPTIRRLADDLGLAPNTVARAYRELEHDGVIETRGRHGTFVSGSLDRTMRLAQEAAMEYAQLIRRLEITSSDALRFVERALDASTG
jgi:DNA-binding transcriptional regulator YhcF (GntR family)